MNFLSNLADSIPVVGHVKGVIHYAAGDTEGGNKAMYQATRTTAVLGAGAAGSLVGPGGAIAAAVYAGAITDGVASVAMDKPQGVVKGCKNIAEDINEGKNPMGSIASTGFQMGMDGLGGLGMGGVSNAASQVSGKAVAKGAENIAKTAVKTVGEKAIQKTVKMTGEEVVKTVTKTVTEKAVKKVIETAAVHAEIALVSTHVYMQADERTKEEEREKSDSEESDREERDREERQRRDRERREREERERHAREERERRAREERQQQERRAREQQEQRAREQQEQRAREQQEQRAREQQEQRAREQQEQRAREQQEQRAREQQEQRAREQQEQRAREQQEQRAREQQEQRAREQQEQRAREQQEQRAREQQEQRDREQQEQRDREQQEQRVREQLQQRFREQVEQCSTPESNSGSSQPPQGNRNNNNQSRKNKPGNNNNQSRKNKPNYFAIFKNLLKEILDVIFGVERPYTRARVAISQIFRGLSEAQKDYLGKIIERLYKGGILVEVLILVIRISSEHFTEDISFTNFLSLTEFVAVYIKEEIIYRTEVFKMDQEISRENDSSIPKEEPENLRAAIISSIMNLADIVSRIVDIFERLRIDIEYEKMPFEISEILLVTRDLSSKFRDVFSEIYHYFKHRCVTMVTTDGRSYKGVLSVREYYDWIRRVLEELGRDQDYRNLIEDTKQNKDVKANVKFEIYVPIFNRRIRIIVKVHGKTIVLASCYVLDDENDGDKEGMVWINIRRL